MYTRNIIILIFLCSCRILPLHAQLSGKQPVINALTALAERYRSYKNMHVDISYRYAAEDRPGIYLDSLGGDLKMNGSSYKYRLDSTEFIGSPEILVTLFRQDRIMFLSRPAAGMMKGNPMALLDSFLMKNDSIRCQLTETKQEQLITITFRPGMTTKRIEYTIDRGSGLLTRIVNVVESKQLYDPSVRSKVDDTPSYARVEMNFSHYRQNDFEAGELDPARYFKKEGGEYSTLPPYGEYKIFKGNPDL